MKNYIVVFGVPVTTSFLAPKTIGGVTAEEAQVLTDLYLAADPGATQDGPPARFYWLLNKRVVSQLYVSQTDSFDPFHNPQFTQDTKVARHYGIESELGGFGWGGTDNTDPAQVKAAKIAAVTTKTSGGKGGTLKISLLSYLLLLLNTWQTGATGNVPQRWQEWLALLISHYGRYTPSQIYGFLARGDFAGPTFKV